MTADVPRGEDDGGEEGSTNSLLKRYGKESSRTGDRLTPEKKSGGKIRNRGRGTSSRSYKKKTSKKKTPLRNRLTPRSSTTKGNRLGS